MNQEIIEYLKNNKGIHKQEVLVQQLKDIGHTPKDIFEAVEAVYTDAESDGVTQAQKKDGGAYWGGLAIGLFGTMSFSLIAVIVIIILNHVIKKDHPDLMVGMMRGMYIFIILAIIIAAIAISFFYFLY